MAIVRARLGRRHKPCSICKKHHAPWWASNKGRWKLSIEQADGTYKQITLSADHDEAIEKWHRIEAGIETIQIENESAPSCIGDALQIGELAGLFLESLETRISLKTLSRERFEITERIIKEFVRGFGNRTVASLRVGGVDRVQKWINDHKTWGSHADVISRIRQFFNWATKGNYIAGSPIAGLAKPKFGKRVMFYSQEQVDAILAAANDHFARGFKMLNLTGCRPDEICSLDANEVCEDRSGLHLMVENHKNRHRTGKPRRVFLVPEAAEIVREQLRKYPNGRLFRSGNKTNDGSQPSLSPEYFNHALRKICDEDPGCIALGLDEYEIKAGKKHHKYQPYTSRHTFAVRYLTGYYKDAVGKPIILNYGEVAALLGNTAKMVEEIYGHLVDQTEFLTNRLSGSF